MAEILNDDLKELLYYFQGASYWPHKLSDLFLFCLIHIQLFLSQYDMEELHLSNMALY